MISRLNRRMERSPQSLRARSAPIAVAGLLLALLPQDGICQIGSATVAPTRPVEARHIQTQRVGGQKRPGQAGRISVSFSDTDVRDILATIADYSGVDILVTPGATGKISLSL